jgi:hypothetical protein
MSESQKIDEAQQRLVDAFRAYLHTVITAHQYGKQANLQAMPGPKTRDYCAALAKLPGNSLAAELAAPINALINEIDEAAMTFYRPLYQNLIKDPAKVTEHERILQQLDFALALVLRRLPSIAQFRARSSKDPDLMCEVVCGMAGHGPETARLVRRYMKEFTEEIRNSDGSLEEGDIIDDFAWDVYERVEALDRFADEFPEHVRLAARYMHGWPMLVHRHTANKKRFAELVKRLDLGAKYPLDATESARFRPDSPMVRYLDPLVHHIHYVHSFTHGKTWKSEAEERKDLAFWWRDCIDDLPDDQAIEALRGIPKLPLLTKITAPEWSEKAVVPIIMAGDARDWKNCTEPALKRIARQAGVKSRATFKSRLSSAVTATLRALARA